MTSPDIPKMGPKTFKFSLWAIKILGILITIWIGSYLISQSVPYAPYRVLSYEAVPSEVCAGDAIRVDVKRFADPDGNIESINTRTSWQNVDTDVSAGIQEFVTVWGDRSVDYGIATVPSNVLRAVPQEAGEYRIVSEYDIQGQVFIFDRTVTSSIRSEKVLTVLDEGSEKCQVALR